MRCDAMRCDAMRCDAMRCDAMRCAMEVHRTDSDVVADDSAAVVIGVQRMVRLGDHRAVLDVGSCSDADQTHVGADHAAVPNRRLVPNLDVASERGARSHVCVGRHLGRCFVGWTERYLLPVLRVYIA